MSNNDPFADFDSSDATILKPTPGGGRFGAPPQAVPGGDAAVYGERARPPAREGLNRLETAAADLLTLLTGLKNTHSHPDVAGLHRQLINEIKAFEAKARALGMGNEQTLTRARYVLCATIDDVVLNTPWGQQFGWSHKTLQGTFFRKEWAGDEFFQLLDRLIQDPATHRELLELMYICLALGFKGGYRVYDRQSELEDRREHLYRVLRSQRGDVEPELSPHWRGVTGFDAPVMRGIPLWAVAAIAALLLLLLYFFLNTRLNGVADPVFAGLQEVRGEIPARPPPDPEQPQVVDEPEPPPPPVDIHQDLRRQLLGERCLDTGDVVTGSGAGRQVVGTYIRTNANCRVLFDSGKWDIKPEFAQLLDRVGQVLGQALQVAPGRVLVTGHTDNVPGRFISNAELSQNRAEAVMQYLVLKIGTPERFRAEGRADREPVASNETPEGRARNRRVEIMLLYPHIVL